MHLEVRYNRLAEAKLKLQEDAREAVEEASSEIEQSIRRDIADTKLPVRREVVQTGFRAQIRVGNRRRFYPAFLEYGTSTAPARPFATPAADAARPAFMARMRRILRKL